MPVVSDAAKAHQIPGTLSAMEDVKVFWIGKIQFARVLDEETQRLPIQASGAFGVRIVLQNIVL